MSDKKHTNTKVTTSVIHKAGKMASKTIYIPPSVRTSIKTENTNGGTRIAK